MLEIILRCIFPLIMRSPHGLPGVKVADSILPCDSPFDLLNSSQAKVLRLNQTKYTFLKSCIYVECSGIELKQPFDKTNGFTPLQTERGKFQIRIPSYCI